MEPVPRQNLIGTENAASLCRDNRNRQSRCDLESWGTRTFSMTATRACARRACIYKEGRESQIGSGSPLVTMMQPSESFMRKDATQRCRANPAARRSLLESKMRSVGVVVTDIMETNRRM